MFYKTLSGTRLRGLLVVSLAVLLFTMAVVLFTLAAVRTEGTTPSEARALRAAAGNRTAYTLSAQKLEMAQELFRARTTLHFGGEGWEVLQLVLLLGLGSAAWMSGLAERLTRNRWGQCFAFVFLLLLAMTLLNAPMRVYGHHVGLKFGLSVQGWGSWAGDQAKGFLLTWIGAGLLVKVLFWVIGRSPGRWWFWFWIPAMASVLFGVVLAPVVVDPLFNKFEPLERSHPALTEKLEEVAVRSGVPLPADRMFLMRASRKVTSLNAYVTGFGPSKRLVLWDTTVAGATQDELAGVFGHELGHYALHHIVQGVLFSAVLLLAGFYLGQRMALWLLRRYGAGWRIRTENDWAFLVVLVLVLQVLSFVSEPIDNAFSRSIEHAADVYGLEAIHGVVADPQSVMAEGFQRLGEASLEDPTPHPIVNFWEASHPPIVQRSAFAAAYNPWAAGEHPKYFENKP